MRIARRLLELTFSVAVLALEAILWIGYGAVYALGFGRDVTRSLRIAFRGRVLCPRGHALPFENATYTCSACGYTYDGSVWVCGNSECRATTAHTECPTCGLSVRNPFRS